MRKCFINWKTKHKWIIHKFYVLVLKAWFLRQHPGTPYEAEIWAWGP